MQFAALGVPASASFLVFMFHDYLGILVNNPAAAGLRVRHHFSLHGGNGHFPGGHALAAVFAQHVRHAAASLESIPLFSDTPPPANNDESAVEVNISDLF